MITFNSTITPVSNSLLVVDALNMAFRYRHQKIKDFAADYYRTVESLKKSYKSEHVIIACDSGSSSFRKTIYPEYKSARKEKYDAQSDEEKEEFNEFFEEFNKVIEEAPYLVFRFSRCEADDIAAYITQKFRKHNIWLISSDKDWDLLINDKVSRFSYVTRKEITANNWDTHYDVSMDKYLDYKCLVGDSGDSIPGVPGVGPKKALDLLNKYGNIHDIALSLPINSKYKYIQELNKFGPEGIFRNLLLMDLVTHCEEALGEENCQHIDSTLQNVLQI